MAGSGYPSMGPAAPGAVYSHQYSISELTGSLMQALAVVSTHQLIRDI